MTRTERMNQFRLIEWALELPIDGRADAVHVRRKMLLFLIANAVTDEWAGKRHKGKLMYRFNDKRELARDIQINERRLYRAIDYLVRAGLVERCAWSVRRLYLVLPEHLQ